MDDDRQIEAELHHNFYLLACSPPKLLDQSSIMQCKALVHSVSERQNSK